MGQIGHFSIGKPRKNNIFQDLSGSFGFRLHISLFSESSKALTPLQYVAKCPGAMSERVRTVVLQHAANPSKPIGISMAPGSTSEDWIHFTRFYHILPLFTNIFRFFWPSCPPPTTLHPLRILWEALVKSVKHGKIHCFPGFSPCFPGSLSPAWLLPGSPGVRAAKQPQGALRKPRRKGKRKIVDR